MENTMENKLQKVILVMDDGEQREYEGEGIAAFAITDDDEKTNVSGGVVGGFSVNSVAGLIRTLEGIFKEKWKRAILKTCLEDLLDEKPKVVGMDPDAGEAACEEGGGRGCTSSLIDRFRGTFGRWKRRPRPAAARFPGQPQGGSLRRICRHSSDGRARIL